MGRGYETKLLIASQEFLNECQIQRFGIVLERIKVGGSAKLWYNHDQDPVVTTRRNNLISNMCLTERSNVDV